ncbi:MAG: DUF4012 domain-containing protein [bacterium]|nr:DUF4012 domain-containing protein [bacterium]
MHGFSVHKTSTTSWQRFKDRYELRFCRLSIAEAVLLCAWLVTCVYHAFIFLGKSLVLTISWASGVTYRILLFFWHTIAFAVRPIARAIIFSFHILFIRPFLACTSIITYFFISFHPLHPPHGWKKTLAGFAVMAIIFILPFPALHTLQAMEIIKQDSMSQAMSGLDSFSKAQDALLGRDIKGAHTYFSQSYQQFIQAENAIVSVPPFIFDIAGYIPGIGQEASDGRKLLEAGKELSLSGQFLTTAFDPLLNMDDFSPRSLMSLSDTVNESITVALPHLERASVLIAGINADILSSHQRDLLLQAQQQLPAVVSAARDMNDTLTLLHKALGADTKKRYLVVLQNNTEIRATGGFIGSFALVDIDRGNITSIEIPPGGSYDLQGSLTEHVISPDPLHLINPQWQFQDANWFPDFPTSAKKLEWFYEHSGGSTVDGVIAINANLGKEILKLTGPIDMPVYEKTINQDNFLLEIQKSVELDYDRSENKPKKLLSDLIPIVMERLIQSSENEYASLIQTLLSALSHNDIQVYLSNEIDQALLQHLGFGGYVKNSPRDYAMIIDTNIAGGKTDSVIHSKINELIIFNENGTIDVNMRIWRQHTGAKGDLFTGVNNVDYMRLYTPQGSRLLSADGFQAPDPTLFKNPPTTSHEDFDLRKIEGDVIFDIAGMYTNDEFGKTVFGNWIQTKPGTTSLVEIRYRLPFTVDDLRMSSGSYGYVHLLQRQSASVVQDFSVDIVLPLQYRMAWVQPNDGLIQSDDRTWHWESIPFDSDAFFAFTFVKP